MYLAGLYSGKVSETADSLFETRMAIDRHVLRKHFGGTPPAVVNHILNNHCFNFQSS
jgi:hypothetical protein